MNARLLLGLLLETLLFDQPHTGLTIVRWQLTNETYYRNQTPTAGDGDRRVFQFKRAEARDDGLERCAREIQRESQGGAARSRWCQAFADQLAPSFRFVLQSDSPGPVVISSVVVHVHDVQVLLSGRGFLKDEARYDIQIKPEKGAAQTIAFKKPLEFTGLGTIDIRLGFDLRSTGRNRRRSESI